MLVLRALSVTNRILIAPLNWGLGHATRCIPLIEKYLGEGWEVTLASDGDARKLLQAEYPRLECHELPGYGITYPRNAAAMMASMASQIPRLTARINQEKKWLDRFLDEHPQDLILSDSRYGLHSTNAKSVILCHQTRIRSPRMEGMLNTVHARLLNRFDEVWIPDDEQRTLSGELSTLELKIPIKCVGILSRMKRMALQENDIPVLAILSGPEPQRTMLEERVLPIVKDVSGAVLIRGVMTDETDEIVDGLRVIGYALRDELQLLMNNSALIICRSGYSSIMDLHAMGKRAILIPTPGQTEQEYLAEHVAQSDDFAIVKQDEIASSLAELIYSSEV